MIKILEEDDPSLLALTPQSVTEEMKVISLLRQELHNTHEDYDGTSSIEPPIEPAYPTVDADALRVLKCTSYPFLVCEEAPSSYQAPIPYKLEGVVELLRDQIAELEKHLQSEEARMRGASNGKARYSTTFHDGTVRGSSMSRYPHRFSEGGSSLKLFMDVVKRDACFADVSREVSIIRWYTRWVSSHSERCLEGALEQVEYVLSEGALTTEEELVEAMKKFTFVEAVSILENDRMEVIEAERKRMRSHSRTFREHISPLAITAAASSFLTPEEKYRYQEVYNQSKHVMMVLHHALHAQSAERVRRSSLVDPKNSSSSVAWTSSRSFSLSVRDGPNAEEVQYISDAAAKVLRQEREVITYLLQKIHERQKRDTCVEVAREQYRKSRLAAMVVYKCLVDDILLLRTQKRMAKDFLKEFDSWIFQRCGMNHESIVIALGIPSNGMPSSVKLVDYNSRKEPAISSMRDGSVLLIFPTPSGPLPRHIEEVCESLMSLLKSSKRSFGTGVSTGVCETLYRRWMCLSLRYTCMQIIRGRWSGDVLYAGMDDIANHLIRLFGEYNSNPDTVQSYVSELIAVLRCFLGLVAQGASQRQAQREFPVVFNGPVLSILPAGNGSGSSSLGRPPSSVSTTTTTVAAAGSTKRTLDISVTFSLDRDAFSMARTANVSDEDEYIWDTIFDLLWFQADPSDCAHGGFLIPSDSNIDIEKPFVFLRLESISIPEHMPKSAEGQQRLTKAHMTLHYAIFPSDMTTGHSLAHLVEETTGDMPCTSFVTRYSYTRRVLYILSMLEKRQLLQDYSCREDDVDLVPLENTVFFSRKRDDKRVLNGSGSGIGASTADGAGGAGYFRTTAARSDDSITVARQRYVTVVGILPPAAISLMRHSASPTGTEYSVASGAKHPLNTLTLLIGNMLKRIASRRPPLLSELNRMGDELCTQGIIREGERNGKIHGGRVKSVVQPVLQDLDDYISSKHFNKMVQQADEEMRQQNTEHGALPSRYY